MTATDALTGAAAMGETRPLGVGFLGLGTVGAGVARAPLACFENALLALAAADAR